MADTCSNCAFGKTEGRGVACRRYPPPMLAHKASGGMIVRYVRKFPHMERDDWCGEHQRLQRDITPADAIAAREDRAALIEGETDE